MKGDIASMYTNSGLVDFTKISPNRTIGRTNIKTVAIHCMAGHSTVEGCGDWFSHSSTGASANYGIDDNGRVGMYVEEKDRAWTTSSRTVDMSAITIEVASDKTSPYKVTDKAYDKLIALVVDICKRNNIKCLKWSKIKATRVSGLYDGYIQVHMDYKNKDCPGEYLCDKMEDLVDKVNKTLGNNAIQNDTEYTQEDFVREVQTILGAKIDGIAGPETLSKTITVSAKTNRKHKVVKPIQKQLKTLGYIEVGEIDGIAGNKFAEAVMHFQSDNNIKPDGIITSKKTTWKKLLRLEG